MAKRENLKEKNGEALAAFVAERRKAVSAARFGTAGSRSKNVREVRSLRRDIARGLTELQARAMETLR